MKRLITPIAILLLIALTACTQTTTYPDVQGTWTDSDAFFDACDQVIFILELDITQNEQYITGDVSLYDPTDPDPNAPAFLTGTLDAEFTSDNNITGEMILAQGNQGVLLDLTATFENDTLDVNASGHTDCDPDGTVETAITLTTDLKRQAN